VLLVALLGAACHKESSSEAPPRSPAAVEARPATESRRPSTGADAGVSPDSADVALKPVAGPPIPQGFQRVDVALETGGRALYAPEDRKAPSAVLAQGFEDLLRVEKPEDFTRFVRIRNEPEALQYVRLLDALQGALPGLECFDPVKTPGEQLTEKRHPLLTMTPERAESDLKLYRPPVQKIDRARIRLSRETPQGPFVVERYLVCGPRGGARRLVFARETVGRHGEYKREDVEVLAQGNFD